MLLYHQGRRASLLYNVVAYAVAFMTFLRLYLFRASDFESLEHEIAAVGRVRHKQ